MSKTITGEEIVKLPAGILSKFNFTNGKRYIVGFVSNALSIMDTACGMTTLSSSSNLNETFVMTEVTA